AKSIVRKGCMGILAASLKKWIRGDITAAEGHTLPSPIGQLIRLGFHGWRPIHLHLPCPIGFSAAGVTAIAIPHRSSARGPNGPPEPMLIQIPWMWAPPRERGEQEASLPLARDGTLRSGCRGGTRLRCWRP